jgi:hypothetical protein
MSDQKAAGSKKDGDWSIRQLVNWVKTGQEQRAASRKQLAESAAR